MKKMLQRIAQSCLEFDVSDRTVHCMQKSWQELCKLTSSSQDLSIIYLRVVNSHQFNQSDLDTRSWYHGMAASKECLQAPLAHSLLTRPLSAHPTRPRLHSAISPETQPGACSQANLSEVGGGGSSGTVHEQKKIANHGISFS